MTGNAKKHKLLLCIVFVFKNSNDKSFVIIVEYLSFKPRTLLQMNPYPDVSSNLLPNLYLFHKIMYT